MDSFKGKTIAVVGGSKGLGLTLSQTLLEKGANVIVLSRSEGQLSGLRDRYPNSLSWYASDISDYQQVGEVFSKISQEHPRLDSLVLNAAMTTPRYFVDITEEDVADNLGVNVSGMIYCLQKAVPLLEGGRAVFISSESAEKPLPMLSLYAMVKVAMETMFKAVRHELYTNNKIQLTVLRSGSMAETSFSADWTDEVKAGFVSMVSQSAEFAETGTPMPQERVVEAILFVLGLAPDATVNMMDLRSGDSA